MAEIKAGYYQVGRKGIYITQDQFMWEYSWFYIGEGKDEKVYMLAIEFKTNTTYTSPVVSNPGEIITPKIHNMLDNKTEFLKYKLNLNK